jgi:hypothetical protein
MNVEFHNLHSLSNAVKAVKWKKEWDWWDM